jgi:glucan phosphoethanolaminetransferase (alkaline phosphatase superfamily)
VDGVRILLPIPRYLGVHPVKFRYGFYSWETGGRLALQPGFFFDGACILRLARPRLATWLVQCLLAFLALFTFVSVMHFLLFGQIHRFIVLHLMGTHHAYDLRYPNEFARFDHMGFDEGTLHMGAGDPRIARYNQYDNAVLYNDYILGEIIKLVKGAGRTTLTYLSDHGEALGETSGIFGHFDGTMPRQVYDIPLIFLLSESAKSGLGEKMAVFRANLNKPFQSDFLIHTLLDLYEVGHEAWRQKRSLFNPEYSPGQRYCDTLEP